MRDGCVPLRHDAKGPASLGLGTLVICGLSGGLSSSVSVESGPPSQGGDLLVRKDESVVELTSLFHGDPVMPFSVRGGSHQEVLACLPLCPLRPERASVPSPSLRHSI